MWSCIFSLKIFPLFFIINVTIPQAWPCQWGLSPSLLYHWPHRLISPEFSLSSKNVWNMIDTWTKCCIMYIVSIWLYLQGLFVYKGTFCLYSLLQLSQRTRIIDILYNIMYNEYTRTASSYNMSTYVLSIYAINDFLKHAICIIQ